MRATLSRCALALLLAVAGCGGDGGGGDGAIAVTYDPPRITAFLTSWESGQGRVVRASLSSVPEVAYPQVLDSGSVFVPGATYVTANPDGTFSVTLRFSDTLAPGTYGGTITLRLRKDPSPACTNAFPLTGNVLPYTVTKTPPATTTATAELRVDGISQAGTGGTLDGNGVKHYSVSMPSGSTLEVASTVSIVSWDVVSGASHPSVQYTTVSSTVIGVRLTLSVASDVSETTTVRALAADGQMFIIAVTVTR